MKDSQKHITILNSFMEYYEYNGKSKLLNLKGIPQELFNVFHENNTYSQYLYSGSKSYRTLFINDWTTCKLTAKAFATKDGFLTIIAKEAFARKFKFISMDVLYDYLCENLKEKSNLQRLHTYVSESEVYAVTILK